MGVSRLGVKGREAADTADTRGDGGLSLRSDRAENLWNGECGVRNRTAGGRPASGEANFQSGQGYFQLRLGHLQAERLAEAGCQGGADGGDADRGR